MSNASTDNLPRPVRFDTSDTIAAIASPRQGGARGIVRISGPRTRECLDRCFSAAQWPNSVGAQRMVPGQLRCDEAALRVPCDLLWWPTARSYTGQPVAELHMVGCPPLMEVALETVCAAGARLADRGEFTMRAFLSGRIDLAQAEAVMGVIDARAPRQLEYALAQLAGGISRPIHNVRNDLLDLLADVEAGLDFADEDLPLQADHERACRLEQAGRHVEELARRMGARRDTSACQRVVLTGMPNTGKSSLFNALVGRSAAITSNRPGTTRDYLTAKMECNGVACELVDTAGIESLPATIPAERAAHQAAERQRQGAWLVILCLDVTRPLADGQQRQLEQTAGIPRIIALTKCDLMDGTARPDVRGIRTSSRTGQGIAALRERIGDMLLASRHEGPCVASTAVRCAESLRGARAAIDRACQLTAEPSTEELVAVEIRDALDQLGQVVGAVFTDDLLDRVFSKFCIGK